LSASKNTNKNDLYVGTNQKGTRLTRKKMTRFKQRLSKKFFFMFITPKLFAGAHEVAALSSLKGTYWTTRSWSKSLL